MKIKTPQGNTQSMYYNLLFVSKLHFNSKKIMKPYFYLFLFIFIMSCSKNSVNKNCNFLLDIGVSVQLNLNLPQYSQLQFPSNPVYVANAGNGGIIVTNTGTGFVSFDAADPNHAPSSCSVLSISGIFGTCNCDDENKYNLINGLIEDNTALQCPLKVYRVEQNGNLLLVFN